MIVWKQIKPKPFRRAAFRLEIAVEMNKVAEEIKRDFEKTVATWENKPVFEIEAQLVPPTIIVDTDNEIYRYVNDGTPEHIIVPRRAKALKFMSGYNPKTTPNFIGSSPGGSFGDVVFSRGVIHPGTEARNFDKEIQRKWKPKFKKRMQGAMNRGARASGHAL